MLSPKQIERAKLEAERPPNQLASCCSNQGKIPWGTTVKQDNVKDPRDIKAGYRK